MKRGGGKGKLARLRKVTILNFQELSPSSIFEIKRARQFRSVGKGWSANLNEYMRAQSVAKRFTWGRPGGVNNENKDHVKIKGFGKRCNDRVAPTGTCLFLFCRDPPLLLSFAQIPTCIAQFSLSSRVSPYLHIRTVFLRGRQYIWDQTNRNGLLAKGVLKNILLLEMPCLSVCL